MDLKVSEINARNVFKYETGNRLCLLCIDALDFYNEDGPDPRLKIRLCNFDKTRARGDRITSEVDAFLPVGQFLVLANDVLTGRLSAMKKAREKAGGAIDKTPYFERYGARTDASGTPISRQFRIIDGLGNASFALVGAENYGYIDDHGQTRPLSGKSQIASVFINFPDEKLKELCLVGKMYIEQFAGLLLKEQLEIVRAQRENKS